MSAILTLNAGSSSIKFAVFLVAEDGPDLLTAGLVENIGGAVKLRIDGAQSNAIEATDHEGAVQAILNALDPVLGGREVIGVGHRVVHGGPGFSAPAVLDAAVIETLEKLVPLAPLHQPHNLSAVRAAQKAFPKAQQVACFDTAFHRGKPFVHDAYALPRHYYEEGIRRYGFHGLSYDYLSDVLQQRFPSLAQGRVIIAHLGNGASLCGLREGKSVVTTMGFSALDGLAMGTRPGQIDPGVLLYLLDQGMTSADLTWLLYHESGLKGLSGLSNDMRELMASDLPSAASALEYYIARLKQEIGSVAAALGGVDGLVFSGGVGENAGEIREKALDTLGFLGLEVDVEANRAGRENIGRGKADILVIPTNEELVIACSVAACLC